MRTDAFNLNIDGADVARIYLSIPSARKVVLDFAYPDMVDLQFVCPPDRVLAAAEEFLRKYYGGHKVVVRLSERAQAAPCEVNFKEWLEKTLADLREQKNGFPHRDANIAGHLAAGIGADGNLGVIS